MVQMDAHTHIQKKKKKSVMHFIYNQVVFLWGMHLSELFSSDFCHISLSVPSWPLSTLP